MDINVESLLDKVSGHVKELARTETVLGEEFKIGEFTCRPVIKVGTGFGSGMGSGEEPKSRNKGTGGGAAAGIGVIPLGFLVTKGGEISFIPVDKKTALSTLFEKVPDLVEKLADMKSKPTGKEEKKEEKETRK
jgi:uncharacterized spore protein YtfJ